MLSLDGGPLTLEQLGHVAGRRVEVRISPEADARMAASRAVVERILAEGHVVYGVNTGFGALADRRIEPDQVARLQLNLVRSHACGVGEPLAPEEVRAMLVLRANVLAKGLSGTRPEVAHHLVNMLAADVLPVVPGRGSVGASGDLAPLAHLALGAIGEGEAFFEGRRMPAAEALAHAGLRPLVLEAKEGLALLNGTQGMLAVGGLALLRAEKVLEAATCAAALSTEALLGTDVALDERIHRARGQASAATVAAKVRGMMRGSALRESHRYGDPRVQDAYSLRCVPQVHGAVLDALRYAHGVLETETGAATDNPLVFVEEGEVISGGNFHGAPVALALDFAAIALTHLAGIVERRIDRLVNPTANEGLSPFLAHDPGLESGLMIPHVVAAALLNECRVLAHPASTDNVPTSGGKEDHVSMGMTAALKLKQVVACLERMVAIELLAAADGIDQRAPLAPGEGSAEALRRLRALVPPRRGDVSLTAAIERLAECMHDFECFCGPAAEV